MKICPYCQMKKALTEFRPGCHQCKSCARAREAASKARRKEEASVVNATWRIAKKNEHHSPEEVLEIARASLSYDPLTGLFVRTRMASGGQKAGTIAGSPDQDGYLRVMLAGKQHKLHRLAWLMTYGCWPDNTIDHINRIKTDNRISNLRDATCREQSTNNDRNTSGYAGVSWRKRSGKWVAQVAVDGKKHHLGYFDDPAHASAAYQMALATLNNRSN